MNAGLHHIELTRPTTSSHHFRMWPEQGGRSRSRYLEAGLVGALAILTAGAAYTLAKWPPPSGHVERAAGSGTVRLMTAAVMAPEPAPAVSTSATPDDVSLYPDTAPVEAAVTDGLTISSQHWRRGGLGSNALVTFTLRNRNDYAVKDIEISCAFSRRDGSHLTDRSRVIHDTVKMKGRKSFAHWHIGFVNVYADRAKCTPVAASRI
jgi:hypothetical protein